MSTVGFHCTDHIKGEGLRSLSHDEMAITPYVTSVNRYYCRSRISEKRFRHLARLFALDLSASDSVRLTGLTIKTANRCMALHDRIDILHNNVGVTFLGGPVELSEERWAQTMQINLGSLFLTTKHILPIMEAQGSGAIINVSSIASIRWLGTAYVSYAASKAAVNQFTQSIALQYAPHGIRANAILPGMMDTPTARVSLQAEFADEAELIAKRNATCPTGKMGDAWDVAWASVFLASDEAKYITGVLLPVDGDMTCKSA